MFYGTVTLGILSTALFGSFIDHDSMAKNAKYFLMLPVIVSVLRIVLLTTVFRIESPVYVIEKFGKRKDHLEETGSIIQKDKITDNFTLSADKWELVELYYSKIYTKDSIEIVREDLKRDMDYQYSRKPVSFQELFSVYYRKKLIIGIALNFFQQFNGINFFIMYATSAFNKLQEGSGNTINLVGAFVNFFSFIPTIYFSNKFGRRFNLLGGLGLQL